MNRYLSLALGLLVAGALVAPSCKNTKEIQLNLTKRTSKNGVVCEGAAGFTCLAEQYPFSPLAKRLDVVADNGKATFSLVTDVIPLKDVPSCRLGALAQYCRDNECRPSPTLRTCKSVPVDGVGGDVDAQQLVAALGSLKDVPVADNAPPGPVIFRVVATTESCSDIEKSTELKCRMLLGCATSCPITVGEFGGEVDLDLDTVNIKCGAEVAACAGANLYTLDEACKAADDCKEFASSVSADANLGSVIEQKVEQALEASCQKKENATANCK